jgi:thiosulfate dehydrogenase (quinone) large subunit
MIRVCGCVFRPVVCPVFHFDLSPGTHNKGMVRTTRSVRQGRQAVALTAARKPSNPISGLLEWISSETNKDGAHLLPLRLFIGLGWLRAAAEKILNPAWFDGGVITAFLNTQLHGEKVVFPAYTWLIMHAFLPSAALLAWIILIGQLLVGLGLIFGMYSRPALIGALFMNLNFIAAGAPSPSVFYVVIQIMLLLSNAGRIFGLDGIAHRKAIARQLEQPVQRRIGLHQAQFRLSRNLMLLLSLICTLLALSALAYAKDFSPKGSVSDPAILMCVIGLYSAGQCLIRAIRGFSVHVG